MKPGRKKIKSFAPAFILLVSASSFLFFISACYFEKAIIIEKTDRLADQAETAIILLKQAANANSFLASKLVQIFIESDSAASLRKNLEKVTDKYKLKPNLVIYGENGGIYSTNIQMNDADEWQRAGVILNNFCSVKNYDLSFLSNTQEMEISDADYLLLRRLLGNLFFPRNIYLNTNREAPRLLMNEFSSTAMYSWLNFDKKKGLIYLIDKQDFAVEKLVAAEINELNQDGNFQGHYQIKSGKADFSQRFFYCDKAEIRLERQLFPNHFISVSFPIWEKNLAQLIIRNRGLILLIYFFLALTLYTGFETMFSKHRTSLGILKKFLLLYLFTSILPALPALIFVHDYIQQYKKSLFHDIERKSLMFLQQIDEQLILEEADYLAAIKEKSELLTSSLKRNGIKSGFIEEFENTLNPPPWATFVVASSANDFFANGPVMKNGLLSEKGLKFENIISKSGLSTHACNHLLNNAINRGQAIALTFQALMATLNNFKLSQRDQLRLEMFFEWTGTIEPTSLIQGFFESLDGFYKIGSHYIEYKNFIRLYSVSDSATYDYGLLLTIDEASIQKKYIENNFLNFNRNFTGLTIAVLHRHNIMWPEQLNTDSEIIAFFNQLSSISTFESKIINYSGQKWFAQALKGDKASFLKFVSLYPVASINEKAFAKMHLLGGIFAVINLIGLWFILSLAKNITKPIKELKYGVDALRSRNFRVRLPDLGKNEFGHLGKLFNQTLQDLEELQTAGFVQEKLLPQMIEAQQHGPISIFGKTISLNDLGGDYFDILNLQNNTGILIGDVAGHGVAASMIMAFVKACVISLERLYLQPNDFLNTLNRLFHLTRNKKQRKFMSLQYVLFDAEASFIFVNAGHCFPILYNASSKKTCFLELVNSPLGASTKEIKTFQKHVLEENQALIFYSDGYYETGDLGVDTFCQIVSESYSADAKEFYDNINNKIQARLGNVIENDDKTLIVVTCRG